MKCKKCKRVFREDCFGYIIEDELVCGECRRKHSTGEA